MAQTVVPLIHVPDVRATIEWFPVSHVPSLRAVSKISLPDIFSLQFHLAA
jgi:hypothetical protein